MVCVLTPPFRSPDAYHTNYNLAGLSAAQNHYIYHPSAASDGGKKIEGNFTGGFGWRTRPFTQLPCDEGDRIVPCHPVYVVPWGKAEAARRYFEVKRGF